MKELSKALLKHDSIISIGYPEDLPPGLDCPQCGSNDCHCEFVVSLHCINTYRDRIINIFEKKFNYPRFKKGKVYKARFKNNVYIIIDEEGAKHQFQWDLGRYFKIEKKVDFTAVDMRKLGRYNPLKED
ncbi:hypothetical protein [Priestia megaterium]|uniref:hypothetical protein n=1 Tax=Priestia megaterium TaxID=1404 RepID=UPI000BFDB041|nr:hypothetical protein [Priestia megaterium]PGQ88344.1 hypothetical protein COA18_05285 [Priestia megaterium]